MTTYAKVRWRTTRGTKEMQTKMSILSMFFVYIAQVKGTSYLLHDRHVQTRTMYTHDERDVQVSLFVYILSGDHYTCLLAHMLRSQGLLRKEIIT